MSSARPSSQFAPPGALVGSTVAGKWRLESLLGSGGMATVYLARAADGTRAALKVLHKDLNEIPEVRKRFMREGPIGSALAGAEIPGLVRVFETGDTDDGTAYLAMEALDGETLFERIGREGTIPAPEVLGIAEQILDVLVLAHARGVIHRDLKPENLFLCTDGRFRILDFGIARVVDAIPSPIGEADTEAAQPLAGLPEKAATRTGVVMGTAAYMAAEQATGLVNEIDARADLFSVGATMFRLLTGRTVHDARGEAAELIAAATEKAPPLSSVAFGVPADLCAVIDRSLAFIKHHRYPDAQTMRDDVRALRAGAPPPYVRAIAEGKIAPGAALPRPEPPPSAPAIPPPPSAPAIPPPPSMPVSVVRRPSSVSPTIVDAPAAGQTRPETTAGDAEAAPDGKRRLLAFVIAAVALTAGVGIGVGIAVTRCVRGHDADEPASVGPAPADGGARPVPSTFRIVPRTKK